MSADGQQMVSSWSAAGTAGTAGTSAGTAGTVACTAGTLAVYWYRYRYLG